MTIQEKIDEVVGQVKELTTQAANTRKAARTAKGTKTAKATGAKSVKKTLDTAADMPTNGDLESTLSGVIQLGNEWLEMNAHARAAVIVLGMVAETYSPMMASRFIRECVDLKQYGELKRKETVGSAYLFNILTMPEYAALIQMLLEDSGTLGYTPKDGTASEEAADEE